MADRLVFGASSDRLKRAARFVLGAIVLLQVAACTYTMVFRYTCDGRCSGEVARGVDATAPDQPKLKDPAK